LGLTLAAASQLVGESQIASLTPVSQLSGLSRVEAASGDHQLVDEGYAIRLRQGIYMLASSKNGLANDYRAA